MYIDVGQGTNGVCAVGQRQGNHVTINGQNYNQSTGKPHPLDGSVCLNYSGMHRNFADPTLYLDILNCFNMDVTHTGKDAGNFNLSNCNVSLNLNAAKNTVTLGDKGNARLNVAGGKAVDISMDGDPTVTQNAGGTYSLSSGGSFVELTASYIGQIILNGEPLSSYIKDYKAPEASTYLNTKGWEQDENGKWVKTDAAQKNSAASSTATTATSSQKSADSVATTTSSRSASKSAQRSQTLTGSDYATSAEIQQKMAAQQNSQPQSLSASLLSNPMMSSSSLMMYLFVTLLSGQFGSQLASGYSPYNQSSQIPWWR